MNKLYKKFLLLFSVASIVAIVGLTGNVAMASTPDGETPANEAVCDILQGGTPGLYGLCVAYCEAQDLDMLGEKEAPNNKILANYNRKMRDGDPAMPCIKAPCPCWSEAELAAITENTTTGTTLSCNENLAGTVIKLVNSNPDILLKQYAIADKSTPLCRFTDRPAGISVRFTGRSKDSNGDLVLPQEKADLCYEQLKVTQVCGGTL